MVGLEFGASVVGSRVGHLTGQTCYTLLKKTPQNIICTICKVWSLDIIWGPGARDLCEAIHGRWIWVYYMAWYNWLTFCEPRLLLHDGIPVKQRYVLVSSHKVDPNLAVTFPIKLAAGSDFGYRWVNLSGVLDSGQPERCEQSFINCVNKGVEPYIHVAVSDEELLEYCLCHLHLEPGLNHQRNFHTFVTACPRSRPLQERNTIQISLEFFPWTVWWTNRQTAQQPWKQSQLLRDMW